MDLPLDLLMMEGMVIDREAQIRELKRYERAQTDRLLAEELQHPGMVFESVTPENDVVERDCAVSSTSSHSPAPTEDTRSESLGLRGVPHVDENELDRDMQLALIMSREDHTPPLPLPSPPSQPTHLELMADRPPNPELISVLPGNSSLFPPSTPPSHDSIAEVETDNFSTAPNSPTSRSPSPPTLPSLLAPRLITPPPRPLQPPSPWDSLPLAASRSVAGLLSFPHHSQSGPSLITDEELARQLQEEEEKGRREQLERQAQHDHHLAMELMRERADEDDTQLVQRMLAEERKMTQSDLDAQIAQALQGTEEVEGMEDDNGDSHVAARLQEEERQRQVQDELDLQVARALQEEMVKEEGSLVQPMATPSTAQDEELARRLSEQLNPRPQTQLLAEPPGWWTDCPNCPSGTQRQYHLIEVGSQQEEWLGVTNPLTEAGFTVQRLQRIQNIQLYQRLQFEKHTMQTGKPEGYKVNEQLLFHTSSADVLVICREGLDQRLARNGRFGTGVYFSDNPKKCHSYWRGSGRKKMFACIVLLGNIKEYPRKQTDTSLRREPQGYDSVKGNVTGEDEYIIYNYYRAMPAYVLEYS